MTNFLWLIGWVAILIGLTVGAVALGLLAGVCAVLGFIALVLVVAGGGLIAFTSNRNEPQ